MTAEVDPKFYERADAHINLSNHQLEQVSRGRVSASMLYGTARFNAWVSATGFASGEEMKESRVESIRYYVAEYEKMLAEHLDDYIDNFDKYMKPTN